MNNSKERVEMKYKIKNIKALDLLQIKVLYPKMTPEEINNTYKMLVNYCK
jgi:hypothetical protein